MHDKCILLATHCEVLVVVRSAGGTAKCWWYCEVLVVLRSAGGTAKCWW